MKKKRWLIAFIIPVTVALIGIAAIFLAKYFPRTTDVVVPANAQQNGFNNYTADGAIAYAEGALYYIDKTPLLGGLRKVSDNRVTYIREAPDKLYAYKGKLYCFFVQNGRSCRVDCMDINSGEYTEILSDVRHFAIAHDRIYYVEDSTEKLFSADLLGKSPQNLNLRSVYLAAGDDCVIAYTPTDGLGGKQRITVFNGETTISKMLVIYSGDGVNENCISLGDGRFMANNVMYFDFKEEEEELYLDHVKGNAPYILEEKRFQNAIDGTLYACNVQAKNVLEPFSYMLVISGQQNEQTVGIWKCSLFENTRKRVSTAPHLCFSLFNNEAVYYVRYGHLYMTPLSE